MAIVDERQHALDLQRVDADFEDFAAALALGHVRMLLPSRGNGIGMQDIDPMLSPHHLEAFLACALESTTKTRHFDREWQELYRLIRHVQLAWEKGQILFGSDLMHAPTNREEMEYLSLIDFAKDCFATCAAYREYPHNRTLDARIISGYVLAWQQHFLVDDDPCSEKRSDVL